MLLVPISKDEIETDVGADFIVVGFSGPSENPTVIAESVSGDIEVVPFSEIVSINGTPVSLSKWNIFEASSKITRRVNLPQPDDLVGTEEVLWRVKSLKLFNKNQTAKGLVLVCREGEILLRDMKVFQAVSGVSTTAEDILSFYKKFTGV